MILRVFERLLNIDDIDCRWTVRVMFLLCVFSRLAVFFNPYTDTDFTWINSWMSTADTTGDLAAQAAQSFPITTGNIVFLATASFTLFFTLMMGILYSALYVRSFRRKKLEKEKDTAWEKDEPAKTGKILKRFLLLTLFYLAVSVPFVIINSNLVIFFCLGFPYVFTAPACYLSGDKGMFPAIPYVVKITKGFYLAHLRSLFLIMLVFFFTDAVAGLTSYVSLTSFYILSAFFSTWITFAVGRYAGMAYCAMRDAHGYTVIKPEKESKIE